MKRIITVIISVCLMTCVSLMAFAEETAANPYGAEGIFSSQLEFEGAEGSGITYVPDQYLLAGISNGDHFVAKGVDFGNNGPATVLFDACNNIADLGGTPAVVSVRLGSADGAEIASVTIGGNSWEAAINPRPEAAITMNIVGVHDVYFVSTSSVFNLWRVFFTEKSNNLPALDAFSEGLGANLTEDGRILLIDNSPSNGETIRYENGQICWTAAGDYIILKKLDFGSKGAEKITFDAAQNTADLSNVGASISIRLDSPTGTEVGKVEFVGTSWGSPVSPKPSVNLTSGITGVHDVYLIVEGSAFNLWQIYFTEAVNNTTTNTDTGKSEDGTATDVTSAASPDTGNNSPLFALFAIAAVMMTFVIVLRKKNLFDR